MRAAATLTTVSLLRNNRLHLEQVVRSLIHDGLDGLECYHSDHTPIQTRICLDLARRFDMLITGGSDFHGPAKPRASLGHPRVPKAVIDAKYAPALLGVGV